MNLNKPILIIIFMIALSIQVMATDVMYDNFESGAINSSLWTNTGCSINTSIVYAGTYSLMCPSTGTFVSKLMNNTIPSTGKWVLSTWFYVAYSPTWNDAVQPTLITQGGSDCGGLNFGYPTTGQYGYYAWLNTNVSSISGTANVNKTWMDLKFFIDNDNHKYGIRWYNINGSYIEFPQNITNACAGTDIQEMIYQSTTNDIHLIDNVEICDYATVGWACGNPVVTTNYTIIINVTYNGTAFANANITLLSSQGASILKTAVSNATGGAIFADLTNATYYLPVASYYNTTSKFSSSGYVYMNDSTPITKNLDFYSTATSTSNTYNLGCQCIQYTTGYYIRNISTNGNQCYSVSSLS